MRYVSQLRAACSWLKKRLAIGVLFFAVLPLGAHTAIIEVGAISTNQDAPLYFINGGGFETNTMHFRGLLYHADDFYDGLYLDELSIMVDPSTQEHGGPAFHHAAHGSYVELMVLSVKGPSGSKLGMWEEHDDGSDPTFLFEVPTGTTNGRSRIALSESDRSPGADPFGYIKSRRVSLSQPGLYVVGFVLLDTSVNGAGGGPIHQASAPFYMYFQAGLVIDSVVKTNGTVGFTIPTSIFRNHYIEATSDLSDPNSWTTILGPYLEEDAQLRTFYATDPIPGTRFYRVRVEDP